MKVIIVKTGYLEENCYILDNENESLIIDPGAEFEKIKSSINNKVVGVLITHHHFDHIGALNDVCSHYKVKEGLVESDNFEYEIIKTPGHTSDSVSYYFKKSNILFSGDFIFQNDIGRTDLPTGSHKEMLNSLKEISEYSDSIIVYPGHGDSTTLGAEKKHFSLY